MAKPGARQASKTLSPAVHGETRGDPKLTYLILRAWALWRMQQSPEWLHVKSVRQFFYEKEVRKIKICLADAQHPLHDKVRERLHAWAPVGLLCTRGAKSVHSYNEPESVSARTSTFIQARHYLQGKAQHCKEPMTQLAVVHV